MWTKRQKQRSRAAVSSAVRRGGMPRARDLSCVDCGESARQYDHARGYDDEHALDVDPVCMECHGRRTSSRGEAPRGEANGIRKHPERISRGAAHSAFMPRGAAHRAQHPPESYPRGDANGARLHPETRARGESHGRSRLTTEMVIALRELAAIGFLHRELALMYDVSKSCVGHVVGRRVWAHVA